MSTTKSNIIALRKKGLTLIANEDTRHIYSGSVRGHFLGWPTITIFVTKTITKWIYEALVILRNFSLLSSRWNNCFFFFPNMKITAKRQRTPNYVELHAWAILSPMRSLYGRKEHLEQAKDINFLVK